MKEENKSLLSVHLAVLLLGMSGLFAKLVHQPAIIIVLGRSFFSAVILFLLLKVRKKSLKLHQRADYYLLVATGVVLALHWTSFMQAIQTSTVAIGTLTFSTFPLFVTFMEPVVFKEKLRIKDVVGAIVMLIGVLLIVPKFSLENQMTQGVIWGLISGFTYAIMSLMNRKFSKEYPATLVSFYEQSTAMVVLLPFLFVLKPVFKGQDILGLVVLGVVFTAVAHSMFIQGLKHVKVQTAGIITGLESVYGIVAAFILLGEVPSVRECFGGLVILGVVFGSTVSAKK